VPHKPPPDGRRAAGPSDRFVALTDRLLAPVILVLSSGRISYLNPAAATLLHQEREWLVGRPVEELTHPGDRAQLRRMIRNVGAGRPSGRDLVLRVRAQPSLDWQILETTADNLLSDEDVAGILLSIHDVTASRAENRALTDLAYRDPVTGLPNRAGIVDELGRQVASGAELVAGVVSIDRLSLAQDSLGQLGAEAVVAAVAKRARSAVPPSATLGRLEGGTFVVILPRTAARHGSEIAWRIAERVRAPMFVGSRELMPSVSVGLAARAASSTVDSLLWDAGIALHRAEARGGGRVETFSNGHREAVIARLELEADLRRAIVDGALWLAFQPIVRLSDRAVTGSEALLRWHHEGGDLLPADFVPIAEETGLIVPIGEWVTGEAARLAGSAPGGRVSVNVSARQLAIPSLPRILDTLVVAHADRSAMAFEVTETLLIEEWEYTAKVLGDIRRLGFRVGLDDFGTGYSSLAYLRRLPIDFLKLDRSLVADVDGDRQARAIIGAVIQMARALDLEVVAEGVERESQAVALAELGTDQAQGHLFGAAAELPPT
jgi:diguanylate cyclase (GGDEF)-like protein/PAS domain S-box-containing protein